jgi:MSHA biogenesis protein MshP
MNRSRGFLLMAALFLIVTFATIGAYLVTITAGQVEAATQDEQGTRAYQAARTGIEWAAYQVLINPAGAFATTTCTTPLASQNLALGAFGGPGGTFQVSVTCTRTTENEAGNTIQVYAITSTGCNRAACTGVGTSAYVERQLQLVLAQ